MNWIFKFFRMLFPKNRNQVPHTISESQVDADNKIREEIITGFVTQFSENQNHRQRIFIQFLSSVLVIIIAYVFVYTNTITPNGIRNPMLGSNNGDSLKYSENPQFFRDSIIKPNLTSALKLSSGDIYSYSIKHLLNIYLFSQFVFIILISMIINMGYAFRRDLRIIHNIRCKYLGQQQYVEIFGDEQHTWTNKNYLNFLPGFNLTLCFGIGVLQLMFFLSIWDYIRAGDAGFLNSGLHLLNGGSGFVKMNTLIIWLAMPILISWVIYHRYYLVYRKIKLTKVKHVEQVSEKEVD